MVFSLWSTSKGPPALTSVVVTVLQLGPGAASGKSVRGLLLIGAGDTVHDFFCNALELALCGPFAEHLPPRPPGFLGARDDELAALHGQIENGGGQNMRRVTQAERGVETVLQQSP